LNASGAQIFVYDRFATDPALARSFVASLIRKTSGTLNVAGYPGGTPLGLIAIGGAADDDMFVAFAGRASGAWAQLGGAGYHAFVSPVGDPLFQ
jgi:hypothetical protein